MGLGDVVVGDLGFSGEEGRLRNVRTEVCAGDFVRAF